MQFFRSKGFSPLSPSVLHQLRVHRGSARQMWERTIVRYECNRSPDAHCSRTGHLLAELLKHIRKARQTVGVQLNKRNLFKKPNFGEHKLAHSRRDSRKIMRDGLWSSSFSADRSRFGRSRLRPDGLRWAAWKRSVRREGTFCRRASTPSPSEELLVSRSRERVNDLLFFFWDKIQI